MYINNFTERIHMNLKFTNLFLRPDEHFTFFNLHILFCANGGGGVKNSH